MEAVRKKILLEPFISRIKCSIPFVGYSEDEYYENLDWGKIPYGVDFDKLTEIGQESIDKYGSGIRRLGKMTFSEIMKAYNSVKNKTVVFPDNDEDLSEEDRIEIEKLRSIVSFIDSKRIIDQPSPMPDCCNPCVVPATPPEYEIDDGDYYIKDVSAYVNVCLTQSANIIGAYTFATKDWAPGKRYFENDKVLYDGKTFKLKPFTGTTQLHGSATDCSGNYLMTANFLTGNSYNFDGYQGLYVDMFETVSEETEIVDMGYVYARIRNGSSWKYYLRPSWGGYVNRIDGITYFDKLMDDESPSFGFESINEYETIHWAVDDKILSHGEYKVSSCGGDIHIDTDNDRSIGYDSIVMPTDEGNPLRWESKLSNFIRRTKTVTDDGNELQGKLVTSAGVMDLIYMIGTTKNVDTTCDIAIGDFLAEIEIIPDQGSSFTIKPVAGTQDDFDVVAPGLLAEYGETGDYVKYQSLITYASTVREWASSQDDGKTGKIVFRYYSGADVELCRMSNNDEDYVYNGGNKGIIYEDTYKFTARKASAIIEGEERQFVYLDIDYNYSSDPVVYENIGFYHDVVPMSEVTARTQSVTEGGIPVSVNFQNADYFMEDYQLGLSFVANNNENVYIDRGSAAAFERHLRLSEVDTIEDLENYGNGMFKMKE